MKKLFVLLIYRYPECRCSPAIPTYPSFSPITHIPNQDIANLRLGLVDNNKPSVFLFVDNVTDKRADLSDPAESFTLVPSINRVITNQPRTISVQLAYGIGGKSP